MCLLRRFFTVVLFLGHLAMKSQASQAESWHSHHDAGVSDSVRILRMIDLAWKVRLGSPDSSIAIMNEVIRILPASSRNAEWKEINLGRAYHEMGEYYWRKSAMTEALSYSLKALGIWEKFLRTGSTVEDSTTLSGRKATTLGHLGNIYNSQRDYERALKYALLALKMDQQLGNKDGVARHTGNIGLIYFYKKDLKSALEYLSQSEQLSTEIKNKALLASVYCNTGNVYYELGDYGKTQEFYSKAIALNRELGDKISVAINLGNKGILYLKQDKFQDAKKHLTEALLLSAETGDKEGCREMEYYLALADSVTGEFKSALMHYRRYIMFRDSISNEQNIKRQIQLEMQYEFDKKDAEAKASQEKKDALAKEEKRKQQIILGLVLSGLVIVVVFAVFLCRSFKEKQKAHIEISRQKHIIEEKQKEVLDSILYARRIQQSLLPNEKYIERTLTRLNK